MGVNIAAHYTKETREFNGLNDIVDELLDNPTVKRLAVVEYEVTRITRNIADGNTETPTINLIRVEPLDGTSAEDAQRLLDGAYTARTGKERPATLFDHLRGGDIAEGDSNADDADGDGPVSERTHDAWLG